MSPDPLSPIAPISSATAALPAQPLPEDRPVAAQQAAASQTPGAALDVEAQAGAAATTPTAAPTPDPVAQAVIDGRASAAARQASLAPLFADLGEASAARQPATAALPADVRAAVDRVLSQRLSADNGVTAQALRDAVARSGLFLEANLAAGHSEVDPANDLKAALLSLRQTLAAAQQALLGGETAKPPAAPTLQTVVSAPTPNAPTVGPTPQKAATETAVQTTAQAIPARPETTPPTTPAQQAATPHAASSPLTVSQPSLLLAAQTAATPATADALLDPAIQTAQRAQQQAQVQTQIEALRQTATAATAAAADLERAANPTPGQATAIMAEDLSPTPTQTAAQTALQNAQTLAQQAAAHAAQLAAGSMNAQRAISQSSLLLAAQAAAIRTEDDEPGPPPARPTQARETPAPVEGVTSITAPPPVRGSALAGQPPAPSTLPTQSGEAAIRHLAEQVDQALARQTVHQLASVPGGAAAEGAETASWMFEIPIATPQGTMIAQFEIDRDGRNASAEGAAPAWRARFSLNFEPLGPVHVQLSQAGPRTAVNLWAEREGSLDLLHAQSADLARDLGGEVRVQGGAPQRPAPPRGQFVDRLT